MDMYETAECSYAVLHKEPLNLQGGKLPCMSA